MVNEELTTNDDVLRRHQVAGKTIPASTLSSNDPNSVTQDSASDNVTAQVEHHHMKDQHHHHHLHHNRLPTFNSSSNIYNSDDTPLCDDHTHSNVIETADRCINNGAVMRNQNTVIKDDELHYPDVENRENAARETEKQEALPSRLGSDVSRNGDRDDDDDDGDDDDDDDRGNNVNVDAHMNHIHMVENRECTVVDINKITRDEKMVNNASKQDDDTGLQLLFDQTNPQDNDAVDEVSSVTTSAALASSPRERSQNNNDRNIVVESCVERCTPPMLQSVDAALVVCGGNNKINNSACETTAAENTEKHFINNYVQCRTKRAINIDTRYENTNKLCNIKTKLPKNNRVNRRMQSASSSNNCDNLRMERDTRLIAEDDTRNRYRRSPRGGTASTKLSTSSSSSSTSTSPLLSSSTQTSTDQDDDIDDDDHDDDDVKQEEENMENNPPCHTSLTSESHLLTGLVISLRCSLPLDKINTELLESIKKKTDILEDDKMISTNQTPTVNKKRLLCLYCERVFASSNLRQKHVERCHSVNQSRRSSSRILGNSQLMPVCIYCGKADDTGPDLRQLLHHLVREHSNKYHACLTCEERYTSREALRTHQLDTHGIKLEDTKVLVDRLSLDEDVHDLKKRGKKKKTDDTPEDVVNSSQDENILLDSDADASKISNKKLKCIPRTTRTTRRAAALKARQGQSVANSESTTTNSVTSSATSTPHKVVKSSVFEKVGVDSSLNKALGHSGGGGVNSSNLANSGIAIDSYEFDENFFRCVAFNIRDNLLNHLDGKLNRDLSSSDSGDLITCTLTQSKHLLSTDLLSSLNTNRTDNLALTALTPVTSLLTSQIGIDAYRQIEYGSKAPQEMSRRHYVKYNFRTRKNKQNENDGNGLEKHHDISKLDMWTQIAMKMRQQKVNNNKNGRVNCQTDLLTSAGEISLKVEELNRILDTRGPFQDLREENQRFMGDKYTADPEQQHEDNIDEVRSILEDLINNVVNQVPKTPVSNRVTTRSRLRNEKTVQNLGLSVDDESLTYLNLSRIQKNVEPPTPKSLHKLGLDLKKIDRYISESDHNLIVSSAIELSGEWARPRIFICGACGVKLPSLKQLEDHKNFIHPYIWCMHYEFVGNQSEFYPHLNIPGIGRVLENEQRNQYNKEHNTEVFWERSDARVCSKCTRQCNSLGELHRHMLECAGDWTWMLAKKKCKYRPYGTRRRRQRG